MSRALWIIAGLIAALPLVADSARADAIEVLRKECRSYRYRAPTAAELAQADELFAILLAGEARLDRAIALGRELSLELILIHQRGEDFLVLTEIGADMRGCGFYAFRRRRYHAVAIQAPHTFHDRRTGEVASALFAESRAVACAWNTVVRTHDEEGEGSADFAHAAQSYYQAFTRAFARVHPRGVVLQLHGYSKEKRNSPEGALSDAIVSDGTREPAPWLRAFSACLSEQLDVLVSLYPRDVSELGGTRNAQGELLRAVGHTGFLHLELSAGFRRTLAEDANARLRLWRCLPRVPR